MIANMVEYYKALVFRIKCFIFLFPVHLKFIREKENGYTHTDICQSLMVTSINLF
jgi:hypothetical protein